MVGTTGSSNTQSVKCHYVECPCCTGWTIAFGFGRFNCKRLLYGNSNAYWKSISHTYTATISIDTKLDIYL